MLFRSLENLKGQVYRLKGFVMLEGEPGCWKVDLVGGEIQIESNEQTPASYELVVLPYLDSEHIDSIREQAEDALKASFCWLS